MLDFSSSSFLYHSLCMSPILPFGYIFPISLRYLIYYKVFKILLLFLVRARVCVVVSGCYVIEFMGVFFFVKVFHLMSAMLFVIVYLLVRFFKI